MRRFMNRWHPLIGIFVALPILAWGLSGLTHPLMRLLRPTVDEAAVSRVAWQPTELARAPTFLPEAGLAAVTGLSATRVGDVIAWRATTPDGEAWFDAATGQRLDDLGTRRAETLARAYSGEANAPVASIRRITAFDDEYGFINKLLPAWRVEFDRPDHLRLYVAADSGQFVTAFDDTRAVLTTIFGWLHTWDFLDSGNVYRIAATLACMALLVAVGVTGVWMYGLSRRARHRPALRAWHRSVGVGVSVATLMFGVSGALHVLEKLEPGDAPVMPHRPLIATANLAAPPAAAFNDAHHPVSAVDLVLLDDAPAWRLSHHQSTVGEALMSEHDHSAHAAESVWPARYFQAASGSEIADGEARRARELAGAMLGLAPAAITEVSPVTRFGGDYGFINKRLPVVRVATNDAHATRYYLDPADGALLARADDRADVEGWTFRTLHKWHFADGLGINGRDALIALFVSGNLAVAGMGTALYLKRRRRLAAA